MLGEAVPRYGSGRTTPDKHARLSPLPDRQAQPCGVVGSESGVELSVGVLGQAILLWLRCK